MKDLLEAADTQLQQPLVFVKLRKVEEKDPGSIGPPCYCGYGASDDAFYPACFEVVEAADDFDLAGLNRPAQYWRGFLQSLYVLLDILYDHFCDYYIFLA